MISTMANLIRKLQIIKNYNLLNYTSRNLCLSTIKLKEDNKLQSNEIPLQKPYASSNELSSNLTKAYKPDNLEKRFLVWTGKYKSFNEVPEMINRDEMERARSRMRIRIANIMMALTLFGCILMIYSGKKAAERGDTLHKQSLDWHDSLKSQPKKE